MRQWLKDRVRLLLLSGGLALILTIVGTVFSTPEITMTVVAAGAGIVLGVIVAVADIARGRI